MNKFQSMTDEYLQRNYVPDVYQHDIYAIDYSKLKEAGITFLSFDIDETIAGKEDPTPSKEALTLFQDLKNMGFDLMLLSNTYHKRAERFAKELGIEGHCIARAKKPLTTYFQAMKDRWGLEKSQMAHVGNCIRNDIAGGNAFGITTCLVRRVGNIAKFTAFFPGGTATRELKHELEKRGIWRKHHKNVEGDQYYQLGELPLYRTASDHIAETAAENLIRKIEVDQAFTLDEILRSSYKANESEGMKTLRTHLGDDIVFTSVWADAEDERELEENELSDGELSGLTFTIGCYTVRSTQCLYQDDDTVDYSQRVPASKNEMEEYLKDCQNRSLGGYESGFREVEVVLAKHRDAAEWQEICMAVSSVRWQESIDFICTVKCDSSAPDEQELLFVLKQYTGDSYGISYWYKLSFDGTLTEYEEHPYKAETYKESWKDADSSTITSSLGKGNVSMPVSIPPEAIPAAKKAAKKFLIVLGPKAGKKLMEYLSEDHGSKVKEFTYQGCPIGLFEDKACIIVDARNGEVVFLTSDTIQNCQFIKKKFRIKGAKDYYYYDITFNDGSKSRVRMSKKYRDAMEQYV